MNGKTQPEAMNLTAGKRYRFRVINISDDGPLVLSLNAGRQAGAVARGRA